MEKQKINNLQEAIDFAVKGVSSIQRSSWIKKGSRTKANENVEIPRTLLSELAQKAIQYYQVLDKLPFDPFCNCKEIQELLQQAIITLPKGELADRLEQICLDYCPNCGQQFER